MTISLLAGAFAAACMITAWQLFRPSENEGSFKAKVSGALRDLGLEVTLLPQGAKEQFNLEGHAIFEATKDRPPNARYNPKRYAIAFFGWYGTEYKLGEKRAFMRDGALAESIEIMRHWAREEPTLHEAVETTVRQVFDYLNNGLKSTGLPEESIIEAQLALLRIMKDTTPGKKV